MNINWNCLDENKKSSVTSDLLKKLFKGTMSYTSDKFGHQTKVSELIKTGNFKGVKDQFFTPNPMKWSQGRSVEAVSCITCVKLDLDLYHGDKNIFLSSEHAAFSLLEEDIPMPTAIINSGAGLHVYYILKTPVKVSARAAHDKVVDSLCEKLSKYNPDHGASKDISRVLRLPMSINSKYDKEVKILWLSDKEYALSDLQAALLGENYNHHNEPATDKQLSMISNMEVILNVKFPAEYKASKYQAHKTIKAHSKAYTEAVLAASGEKSATEKQLNLIDRYCKALEISYPDCICTVSDANEWLKDHKKDYHTRPASDEQMDYMRSICKELCLDIPDYSTTDKVSQFIAAHSKLVGKKYYSAEDATSNYMGPAYFMSVVLTLKNFFEKNKGKNDYKREVALFLLRNAANYALGTESSEKLVKEIADQMEDWSYSSDVLTLTKSAVTYFYDDTVHAFSFDTMSRMISAGDNFIDLNKYKVIPETSEKRQAMKEYKHIYNRHQYINYLEKIGKKTQAESLLERRVKVNKLRSEGKTIKQISKILGVCLMTIGRDVRYLKDHPEYFDGLDVENIYKNSVIDGKTDVSVCSDENTDDNNLSDVIKLNKELCSAGDSWRQTAIDHSLIGNDIDSSDAAFHVTMTSRLPRFLESVLTKWGISEDTYKDAFEVLDTAVSESEGDEHILVQNVISYLFRKRVDIVDSFLSMLMNSDRTKTCTQRLFETIENKFGVSPKNYKVTFVQPTSKQIKQRAIFREFSAMLNFCNTLQDDETALGKICRKIPQEYRYAKYHTNDTVEICGVKVAFSDIKKALFHTTRQDICECADNGMTPSATIITMVRRYCH